MSHLKFICLTGLVLGLASLTFGNLSLAQEPLPAANVPLRMRLKSNCVVAPYCPKVAPCTPCYDLEVTCDLYCKKPEPCSPSYCFEWCTSIYCKKCEPCCYPADPCERHPWMPEACAPVCTSQCLAF